MTTLHYTSGGSGTEIAQAGFNLADVSSVDQLNALPDGMKGLVYLNETDGVTQSFIDKVTPFIGNPKLFGFFLVDEPDPTGQWGTYASAANLKAESDWIHSNVPDAKTYITMMSLGTSANPDFSGTYNPANTGIDYYGIDVYPVRTDGAVDYNMIDKFVAAAQASGIPTSKIIPGYQTFGGGDYNTDMGGKYVVPTAAQMETMMDHWSKLVPSPAFDYAYAWGSQRGDTALESSPELQAVFRQHNLSTAGTAPSEAAATDPISTATVPSEATTGDSTSTVTAPSEATSSGSTSTATAPSEATSSGGTSTATSPTEATSSSSTSTATAPSEATTGGTSTATSPTEATSSSSTSTATAPSEATAGDSNHGKTMLSHLLAGNGSSTATAASGATTSDSSHSKTALSHLLASDGSSTGTAASGATTSDGGQGKTALSQLLAGNSATASDGSHGKTVLSHLLASDGSSTDTTHDNAGDKVSEGSSVDRILASLSHSLSAGSELLPTTNDPSATTATNLTGHGFAQTVQSGENVGAQAKNGAAAEIMSGHGGNDAFDFSKLQDKLHLDQAALTELKSGGLSLHASPAGTATDDGSHHIIFDSSTGSLSLDSDAAGGAAQAQLATHLPLQHHSLI
ncbi:calcium-binding protein [Mesorhizobium sp. LMG 17147]|uniref:calcium-binding protein n=1 Tax=Mesorhizobium sp. LMG 17147 TaxID=2963091 RepID=UPI0020C95217|nr:calcium-binding protein [Mesorhizobium sp. LMG 17147]MCP9232589.1 calcium-binding protein [Mesorhizobium sp. LMG 17147]